MTMKTSIFWLGRVYLSGQIETIMWYVFTLGIDDVYGMDTLWNEVARSDTFQPSPKHPAPHWDWTTSTQLALSVLACANVLLLPGSLCRFVFTPCDAPLTTRDLIKSSHRQKLEPKTIPQHT